MENSKCVVVHLLFVAFIVVCLFRSSSSAEVDDGINTLMTFASSRVAVSKIVFEGKLLGIDEKAAPYRMMARFQINTFFKGSFGGKTEPKTIWIASNVPSYRYDCLKELAKSTNHFVYLNGTYSRLWMAVNEADRTVTGANTTTGGTKADVFRHKVRKIYWISSLPQKVNPKRLEEVKKYSCSECSRKPEVSLTYGSRNENRTTNITLTCKLLGDCKLVSLFYWYKDGQLIDEVEQNQSLIFVDSRKYSSSLWIKKYTNQHHRGKYYCKVLNVLGRKDTRVESLPRIPTPRTTTQMTTKDGSFKPFPGWVQCNDSLCSDRGSCYMSPVSQEYGCHCDKGYRGEYCEEDYKQDDGEMWGILERYAGLNVFLIIGAVIAVLIFVALVVIICCFSRLKKDVHKMREVQEHQENILMGKGHIDLGLQSIKVMQDSSSSHPHSTREIIRSDQSKDFVDSKSFPSPQSKTKDFKTTQPSPIFSNIRRNYQPLENPEKADKSINMSPIFGNPGRSYKPLSPPKSSNRSSSFTHYVIGPPGTKNPEGQKSPPTSLPSTLLFSERRRTEEPPSEDKVDPKLEEELKGILKELGEYVNDNQNRTSNL